jgi:hypothetical protein
MFAFDLGGSALPIGLDCHVESFDAGTGFNIGGETDTTSGFYSGGHSGPDGAGRARDQNDFTRQIGHGSS